MIRKYETSGEGASFAADSEAMGSGSVGMILYALLIGGLSACICVFLSGSIISVIVAYVAGGILGLAIWVALNLRRVADVAPDEFHAGIEVDEEDLLTEAWSQCGSDAAGERLVLVGSAARVGANTPFVRDLMKRGFTLDIVSHLDIALDSLRVAPWTWDALIVDLDSCERPAALDETVRALVDFRRECPAVTVVLLSSYFGRDDLDTDRLAVADISIRWPASAAKVEMGLEQAHENNQQWQVRLRRVDASS